ncbi:Transmembrane protein 170B [Galemys pyrenaicus]|uniref:Transmembrane protein 170B n=1 Tax=Galemys pyrenaicus TaxID=202257 RepID=A0A8J5ZWJ8_GALPY|nr:Transmembrane protein 170B [Galemys pyrenaicus]
MKAEGGDHSMINLSVQQVLSLWAHGTVLRNLTVQLLKQEGQGSKHADSGALLRRLVVGLRFSFLRAGGAEAGAGAGTAALSPSVKAALDAEIGQWGGGLAHLGAEMWYWIFLWALFSSLFVHGAAGVLMFVMLQRHRQGRVISVIAVSIGFLASITGAMITSAAVAGIYRVAGKNMAPLEALVWGVGQTVLTLIISFSRILATL